MFESICKRMYSKQLKECLTEISFYGHGDDGILVTTVTNGALGQITAPASDHTVSTTRIEVPTFDL